MRPVRMRITWNIGTQKLCWYQLKIMKHVKYYTDGTNMRAFTNHVQFNYDLPKKWQKNGK